MTIFNKSGYFENLFQEKKFGMSKIPFFAILSFQFFP